MSSSIICLSWSSKLHTIKKHPILCISNKKVEGLKRVKMMSIFTKIHFFNFLRSWVWVQFIRVICWARYNLNFEIVRKIHNFSIFHRYCQHLETSFSIIPQSFFLSLVRSLAQLAFHMWEDAKLPTNQA